MNRGKEERNIGRKNGECLCSFGFSLSRVRRAQSTWQRIYLFFRRNLHALALSLCLFIRLVDGARNNNKMEHVAKVSGGLVYWMMP